MPAFRRTLASVLLLVLVLSAFAVGPVVPAADAQATSTLVIGVTDLAAGLDPGYAYDFNSWETLSHLYTGLTRQIPGTLDYELALATDRTASDDFLTWTYTLPADAVFTDGTPITADTFIASINRVNALAEKANQAISPYVESVTAPSPTELVFQLKRPVTYFDAIVALPPYFPQHPDLAASARPQPYATTIIGNGPYLLDSFEPREKIVLTANPDYQFGPAPRTATITLVAYARSQDLREALRAHDVDIAWRAMLLGDSLALDDQLEGITLYDVPSTRVYYLHMNHTLEPYDDPLVRQAITLMVDRARVVTNTFNGYATPLTSMVPELYPDAYADLWPDGPDFPTAEEILLTAAYRPRGRARLNVTLTTSIYAYGNQIAGAAVELNRGSFFPSEYVDGNVMTNTEAQPFLEALQRGEGRLMLFAWTPLVPRPDAYMRPLAHSSERIPYRAAYSSPRIDALLDEAITISDPAEAGQLYRAAEALLLENNAIIPVWQEHVQLLAWDDITGIQVEPNFFLHYDTLARE